MAEILYEILDATDFYEKRESSTYVFWIYADTINRPCFILAGFYFHSVFTKKWFENFLLENYDV